MSVPEERSDGRVVPLQGGGTFAIERVDADLFWISLSQGCLDAGLAWEQATSEDLATIQEAITSETEDAG